MLHYMSDLELQFANYSLGGSPSKIGLIKLHILKFSCMLDYFPNLYFEFDINILQKLKSKPRWRKNTQYFVAGCQPLFWDHFYNLLYLRGQVF